MPKGTSKEVVSVDALRGSDKKTLNAELHRAIALRNESDAITNSKKEGALDILKVTLLERFRKLGWMNKVVRHEGFDVSVLNGNNVTITEGRLRKAMMDYAIDPDVQEGILLECKQETPYQTIIIRKVNTQE